MPRAKTAETATSPEAELAGLIATRTNLQGRQAALAVEVEQAVAARRELLIQGADAAAISGAERTCRELEGTAFGIADALAEVERRIADAEARIETARTDAEVEAATGALERDAVEIERASLALTKAIREVARAHATLGAAITGPAAGQFDPLYGPAGPAAVANNLVLQGLMQAMPALGIHAEIKPWSPYSMREAIEGADPVAIAAEFGQRLRETADKVRRREIGHDLPVGYDLVPLPSLTVEEQQIYVITPFQYQRQGNRREMVTSHITHVPRPVAERAIELGVAAADETQAWRVARRREAGNLNASTNSYSWDDCVDIEFDLDTWRDEQLQHAA
ncbi:hypothetical protein [Methylobacterium segetis]|uniref:hypothetical protein n=1 Tax=Methylobacterium segetis TaxID=2488750 RepID=UPI0010520C23|nr:hypothetical protein [Methylobacterium segetis]